MRIIFELGEFIPLGERRIVLNKIPAKGTLHIPGEGAFMPLRQIKEAYKQLVSGEETVE